MSVLLDPPIPDGFDVCNTEIVPGVPNLAYNLQVKFYLQIIPDLVNQALPTLPYWMLLLVVAYRLQREGLVLLFGWWYVCLLHHRSSC